MSFMTLYDIYSTAQPAYLAGLLSAVSPCVVVLIPMIVMRLIDTNIINDNTDKNKYNKLNNAEHDLGSNKSDVEWECDGDSCRIVVKPMNENHISNPIAAQYNTNIIQPIHTTSSNKNGNTTGTPSLLLFMVGFQCSYFLFGYFISYLLTSSIQNSLRLAAGGMSMTFALLSYTKRIEPNKFQLMNNGLVLGITFALLSSFNPCTIPFLAALLSYNTTTALINIMAFAQGIITPSIIFVLIGRRALFILIRITSITKYLKALTNILLFGIGIYIIVSVQFLYNTYEIYVAAVFLACNIYWTINTILIHSLQRSKDDNDISTSNTAKFKSVSNIRLSLFTVLLAVLYICISMLYKHNVDSHKQLNELLQSVIPQPQYQPIQLNSIHTQHRHLLTVGNVVLPDNQVLANDNVKVNLNDLSQSVDQLHQAQPNDNSVPQVKLINDKPVRSVIEAPAIDQAAHVVLDKQDVMAINALKHSENDNQLEPINVQSMNNELNANDEIDIIDDNDNVMSDCLDMSSILPCQSCELSINSYLLFSILLCIIILSCRTKSSISTQILLLIFGDNE